MPKRKQTTEQRGSIFGKFYFPYMSSNYVSAEDCYQAYKQDLARIVEIDGHIFTRIISHCRFYGYEDFSFDIIWQPHTEIHLHDTLVDEYGREFTVRTFEMLRFSGGKIPEWYLNAIPMVITGDSEEIGGYLTRKQVNNDD